MKLNLIALIVLASAALANSHCVLAASGIGGGSSSSGNHNGSGSTSKAGTGEAVKGWASKTFDQATAAHRPILLYIYDATVKTNDTAKFMEGSKFLDDADVKSKEKDFLCIKIKSTDGDGYPHEWMQDADKGAAVLVLSADMKLVQAFSKSTHESNTAENLLKAMAAAVKAAPAGAGVGAGAGAKAANNNNNNNNNKNKNRPG